MKTNLLYGPKDIRLEAKSLPGLKEGQILLEPKFTGICGSDVHYYLHGYCGRFVPEKPFALGHEFSGVIHEVGPKVEGLSPGQEVAVDPSMPCGICSTCREGGYNLCPSMKYFGSASCSPHLDGSLSQFVAVPASNCHILPPGISLSQASLLEPLCVALHAVKRAGSVERASVLITGGGPIGQFILRAVQAYGARRSTVSDPARFAGEFALQSGADQWVNPMEPDAWSGGDRYDVVFEAAGAPSAFATGLEQVRPGGTLVLVGTLPEDVTIPGNLIMNRQLQVLGSFRFAHVFEEAIELLASGKVRLDGLVTDIYGFEEVPQAMKRAAEKDRVMKVQVQS